MEAACPVKGYKGLAYSPRIWQIGCPVTFPSPLIPRYWGCQFGRRSTQAEEFLPTAGSVTTVKDIN
eukprot:1134390-Pelagomonas_calceolata.AAC.5